MNEPTQTIFELVLARPIVRVGGDDPGLVHLWWAAPQQGDRLVQVYVDDRLYDVTPWPDQRELWLVLDRRQAHRIELLGVSIDDERGVWSPRLEHLRGWSPAVRDVGQLALLRDPTLPVHSQIEVMVDGALMDRAPLWPDDAPRAGFGAVFGEGGFGFDAATGPGLGLGELGRGPLGSDGTAWRWRHAELATGEHQVAIDAFDETGQPAATTLERTLAIERLPSPPDYVQMDDNFTLSWA
jgi:hypothetical protein